MQAEHIEIEGKVICIKWPVSKVHLTTSTTVSYEDATGPSLCHFNSPAMAKEFVDWLNAQD